MTNAEKIRSMTDKELALLLCKTWSKYGADCSQCPLRFSCTPEFNPWTVWLKLEADE